MDSRIKEIANDRYPLMDAEKKHPLDENWEAHHSLIEEIQSIVAEKDKKIADLQRVVLKLYREAYPNINHKNQKP